MSGGAHRLGLDVPVQLVSMKALRIARSRLAAAAKLRRERVDKLQAEIATAEANLRLVSREIRHRISGE